MSEEAQHEVELEDVTNPEDSIDKAEQEEFEQRTLKDVILGNQLPPSLLAVAIAGFVIFLQVFVGVAGFILEKYYSLLLSIPFLLVPAFWFWLFYFSRRSLRDTAPLQRTLQAFMLGYFSDTGVYLLQWVVVYGILVGITMVYQILTKNVLLLMISAVSETLFEAIFLEAIPEEMLKFAILYHIASLEPLRSRYGTVVYAIASSLGFVFFSGTLRILRVYWMADLREAAIYFAIEAILTSTMQVVAGLWIGLNFVKQRFRAADKEPIPWWQVVLPSIALHAIFMSFISVLYLLYYWGELDWMLFVLICLLAFIFLGTALFYTLLRVKDLFTNPIFYALLDGDAGDEGGDTSINADATDAI